MPHSQDTSFPFRECEGTYPRECGGAGGERIGVRVRMDTHAEWRRCRQVPPSLTTWFHPQDLQGKNREPINSLGLPSDLYMCTWVSEPTGT